MEVIPNEKIKEHANRLLIYCENKPLDCAFMSSLLYLGLKYEFPDSTISVKAGDLHYKIYTVFEQKVSLNMIVAECKQGLTEWDGHVWCEVSDKIIDVSLFRTIYSDKFINNYKQDMISTFGEGKGLLIIRKHSQGILRYDEKETLSNETIDQLASRRSLF
jgi:hypothetical protein